jgi:long-subunit fatty acid transport protein
MKLKKIITAIFLLQAIFIWSQKEEKTAQKERKIFFGGGLQLGVSNTYTSFGISPSAIYEFSEKFASGAGVSYTYSNNKLYDLKYNIFGMSALALYNPIKQIQLSTEFEEMNINITGSTDIDPYWLSAWYMGVAYSMGHRAAVGMRYDVLYDDTKSVYDSPFTPFIRIYF